MNLKMSNQANVKTAQESDVISARKAMVLLGISNHTFQNAVDQRVIIPQRKIDFDDKPSSYGFEPKYIEDIRKVILHAGKNPGKRLFTKEVKAQVEKVNRKWRTDISESF